jgi:hypothetical protein
VAAQLECRSRAPAPVGRCILTIGVEFVPLITLGCGTLLWRDRLPTLATRGLELGGRVSHDPAAWERVAMAMAVPTLLVAAGACVVIIPHVYRRTRAWTVLFCTSGACLASGLEMMALALPVWTNEEEFLIRIGILAVAVIAVGWGFVAVGAMGGIRCLRRDHVRPTDQKG